MSNEEIKKYAKQSGVRMYELATEFEMNESVLSRMFRCELDEDMKQVIIGAINRLANDKETNGKLYEVIHKCNRGAGRDSCCLPRRVPIR